MEDQSNEFESSPEGSVSIVNVDEDGRRDNRDEDEGDDLDDTELVFEALLPVPDGREVEWRLVDEHEGEDTDDDILVERVASTEDEDGVSPREAATLDSTVDARVAQHTTSLLNDVMDRCLELDSLIVAVMHECRKLGGGKSSSLEELLQGLELHGALESRSSSRLQVKGQGIGRNHARRNRPPISSRTRSKEPAPHEIAATIVGL